MQLPQILPKKLTLHDQHKKPTSLYDRGPASRKDGLQLMFFMFICDKNTTNFSNNAI